MNKLLGVLLLSLSLCATELYQVSTFKALEEMVYDGEVRYSDVFKKGDFGLGTFNGTDGEMIALDGTYYQDSPTGALSLASPSLKTPFAAVTFFKPKQTVKVKNATSFKELGMMLDHFIAPQNTPVAIKISGNFKKIKLRSLKKQTPPYGPLMQNDYSWDHIQGTLVGFWFPKYLDGINVGGYHYHFIDEKKEKGGHVLDLSLISGVAQLMICETLTIDFPSSHSFNSADLEVCQ